MRFLVTFRVEGDKFVSLCDIHLGAFQSTPSVWKVTKNKLHQLAEYPISIHTFRVEGDSVQQPDFQLLSISIHTFRVEGDKVQMLEAMNASNFNPHLPCGR